MRFKHVLITREGFSFANDFISISGRLVKSGEHQVQVHRQLIHYNDLPGISTNDRCQRFGEMIVVIIPRLFTPEKSFYSITGPLIQDFIDVGFALFRLETQRVAEKVNDWLAIFSGKNELGSEFMQRVL